MKAQENEFSRIFMPVRPRSGFSAFELMIVLALLAIVAAFALPAFSAWVDRWRVDQGIARLQSVMYFANAQAIRSRFRVVILARSASCRSSRSTQDWSCGLVVFIDRNQNHVQDADEPTLREVEEFQSLTVMHAGGNNAYLMYGPHGAPIANPSHFQVYPVGKPDSPAAQTICLSFGGRVQVKAGQKC